MEILPSMSYYEPPDYDEPQVDFSWSRTQRTRTQHQCTTCLKQIPIGTLTTVTFERVEGTQYYLRTCTGIYKPPSYNCNVLAGPIARIGYLVLNDDTVAYFPQNHVPHATWFEATLEHPAQLIPITYNRGR